MAMINRIDRLLVELNVSGYRFIQETGISKTTVYGLKNNPGQFPSKDVFDRIIATYGVNPNQIVEYVPDSGENS